MTKPQQFREQRVVSCDTHYQVEEGSPKGPQAGSGMLTTGRVVWVQHPEALPVADPTIAAYAEGIGIVSLDAHCLKG